ncbi:MAG: methyl-accepting chemotaxis protein [Gammaproteobacteria bacterium]|nr:methyl-accepting chemotaxis protein [Gammaproteobacteria bacterium]
MLKNININVKIALGVIASVLITVLMLSLLSLSNISSALSQAESRELDSYYNQALSQLAAEGRVAEMMSALVANIPEVQQGFAEGDRARLAEMLVPSFKVLKNNPEYAARQFQFHLPPATSYLRVHKPGKFGDDLSSFRQTVVKTNETKQAVRGLEKGVAGLGVRGMVPVSHDGKHIGSLEFGMSFGQPFFDNFKQQTDIDMALHLLSAGQLKHFAGTIDQNSHLAADVLKQGQKKTTDVFHHLVNGREAGHIAGPIRDFSGQIIGVLEVAMDRSYYAGVISAQRNETLVIGAFGLLIGVFFSLVLTRTISKPICDVVVALNGIAAGDGDLTQRLDEDGTNEIARLGKAFNKFVTKIQNVVIDVTHSTETLSLSADEMSSIAQSTRMSVDQQKSGVEQVAAAINQMSASVQEVATNTSDAAQSAIEADEQAKQINVIVDDTIRSVSKLATEVEQIGNVINELQNQTQNIDTVLDVIKGIAEQTNLLALNAAIEAARAGEQGRGFAVVADEVRTLASRTQDSTREIQEIIESLQAGANSAVEAMKSGREDAEATVQKAGEAGASLVTITRAIESISSMNTQIATSAQEQSAVANDINQNISAISVLADQSTEGVTNSQRVSGKLSTLSNHLHDLVAQFKV